MTEGIYDLLEKIIRAADDNFAQDIMVFDMEGLSIMSDYNVVAHASNNRLLNAIADRIVQTAAEEGIEVENIEGKQKANWILIDLGDIIFHVFSEEERNHYQLEDLWVEAPKVDVSDWLTD